MSNQPNNIFIQQPKNLNSRRSFRAPTNYARIAPTKCRTSCLSNSTKKHTNIFWGPQHHRIYHSCVALNEFLMSPACLFVAFLRSFVLYISYSQPNRFNLLPIKKPAKPIFTCGLVTKFPISVCCSACDGEILCESVAQKWFWEKKILFDDKTVVAVAVLSLNFRKKIHFCTVVVVRCANLGVWATKT